MDMGDVDIDHVSVAVRVVRMEHLARAQRHPADMRATRLAADEGDQRRGVDRPVAALAGHPAPAAVEQGPAAVMEGGEAPGRVVDPGPAPRLHEGPMALAIGRPADLDLGRKPDRPVIGHRLPLAIGVEVLIAGHVRGNEGQGLRGGQQAGAVFGPLVERGGVDRHHLHAALVGRHHGALAAMQLHGTSEPDEASLARHHAEQQLGRRTARAAGIEVIFARPADRELTDRGHDL